MGNPFGRAPIHGYCGTKEYRAWKSIKTRCNNPNYDHYHRYGGRGIRMHEGWQEDFETFLADVGFAPSPDHSIDRIDNDGNYEPGNVRWATRTEQSRNKDWVRKITIDGVTKTQPEWAEEFGVRLDRIQGRVQNGWDPVDAVLKTKYKRGERISYNGVTKSIDGWAKEVGLSPNTIRLRLKKGWTSKEILLTPARGKKVT